MIYHRYAIVDAEPLREVAAKIDSAMGTISGTMTTEQTLEGARQSA